MKKVEIRCLSLLTLGVIIFTLSACKAKPHQDEYASVDIDNSVKDESAAPASQAEGITDAADTSDSPVADAEKNEETGKEDGENKNAAEKIQSAMEIIGDGPGTEPFKAPEFVPDKSKLTFVKTEDVLSSDGRVFAQRDLYTDADKNEYRFDKKSGDLQVFGCGSNAMLLIGAASSGVKADDENSLVNIAEEYLQKVFGTAADGFDFVNVTNGSSSFYLVQFSKKSGFISLAEAIVKLAPDGTLISASLTDYNKDFDVSLLDGITEQTLNEYLKETLSSNVRSFEIKSALLVQFEGKTYIDMYVETQNDQNSSADFYKYYFN